MEKEELQNKQVQVQRELTKELSWINSIIQEAPQDIINQAKAKAIIIHLDTLRKRLKRWKKLVKRGDYPLLKDLHNELADLVKKQDELVVMKNKIAIILEGIPKKKKEVSLLSSLYEKIVDVKKKVIVRAKLERAEASLKLVRKRESALRVQWEKIPKDILVLKAKEENIPRLIAQAENIFNSFSVRLDYLIELVKSVKVACEVIVKGDVTRESQAVVRSSVSKLQITLADLEKPFLQKVSEERTVFDELMSAKTSVSKYADVKKLLLRM